MKRFWTSFVADSVTYLCKLAAPRQLMLCFPPQPMPHRRPAAGWEKHSGMLRKIKSLLFFQLWQNLLVGWQQASTTHAFKKFWWWQGTNYGQTHKSHMSSIASKTLITLHFFYFLLYTVAFPRFTGIFFKCFYVVS